ncbi:MAG: class I SAM-dependent methyltransferase [Mycobacterium sp.]
MSTRWQDSAHAPRGTDYDQRWHKLAEAGQNVHGEVDFVEAELREHPGARILDAGCGTGRVAIELASRGYSTVGVDADAAMLDSARSKAPELTWIQADLCHLADVVAGAFDAVVLAGNVMIFLTPGTEGLVLQQIAGSVRPGGLVIAGFSLREDRLSIESYDKHATSAGLELVTRWATWERTPFTGGDYVVSVHRR